MLPAAIPTYRTVFGRHEVHHRDIRGSELNPRITRRVAHMAWVAPLGACFPCLSCTKLGVDAKHISRDLPRQKRIEARSSEARLCNVTCTADDDPRHILSPIGIKRDGEYYQANPCSRAISGSDRHGSRPRPMRDCEYRSISEIRRLIAVPLGFLQKIWRHSH